MRPGEKAGSIVSANTTTLSLVDMKVEDLMPLEEGMLKTINYFRELLW